jgi:hypothetical protein
MSNRHVRTFLFLAACLLVAIPASPVMAADVDIQAMMGDTVTISGYCYTSDRMYLFFTGPGIPANGVTMDDITQLAEDGHFTLVDVKDDQTWQYTWNTARLARELDPGTYTVYASTQPVDKSHLGPSNTYQTAAVWLKRNDASQVSGSGSTTAPYQTTTTARVITVIATYTPTPPTTVATATTTTPKEGIMPVTAVAAVVAGIFGLVLAGRRRKEE